MKYDLTIMEYKRSTVECVSRIGLILALYQFDAVLKVHQYLNLSYNEWL